MSVFIKSLYIKNFKCFKEVKYTFKENVNLIIGGNNSGKSTTFDALRLWQLAFARFLKDRTNRKSSSFRAQQYFSFTIYEISFLRAIDFNELFFNRKNKKFEIQLSLSNGKDNVSLPIIFTRTGEGQVLRYELCRGKQNRKDASDLLSQVLDVPKGTDFKTTALFTYINPIFKIPLHEPYYEKGYVINSLHQAKVNNVIRNLIHKYAPLKKEKPSNPKRKKKDEKLKEIEKDLSTILYSNRKDENTITFSTQLEEEDMYISLFCKNKAKNTEVELSLLGSGTLNLINILSVLAFGDYEKFKLNVLLLDEPDSHLHANHQAELFKYLKKRSCDTNKQIFIITHNHELIDCFNDVLFLDSDTLKNKKELIPIDKEEYYRVYKKIAPEYHKKMLEIQEKKAVQEKLNSITKPTLFCEGTSDVKILKKAFKKLFNREEFFDNKINIESANNASSITHILKYNKSKDVFLIGLFDNDYEGDIQKNKLMDDYKNNGCSWHFQKYYKKDNNSKEVAIQSHFLMLPIPQSRIEKSTYYEENGFIEYMFDDKALEDKLAIKLIEEKGRSHKIIKTERKGGKHNYSIASTEKKKVVKNIDNLDKEDFNNFKPLFEQLAKIINYTLPLNND